MDQFDRSILFIILILAATFLSMFGIYLYISYVIDPGLVLGLTYGFGAFIVVATLIIIMCINNPFNPDEDGPST